MCTPSPPVTTPGLLQDSHVLVLSWGAGKAPRAAGPPTEGRRGVSTNSICFSGRVWPSRPGGAGRPWGRDCPSEEGLSQFLNMPTAQRLGAVGERWRQAPSPAAGSARPPPSMGPRPKTPPQLLGPRGRPLPTAPCPLMVQDHGNSRDLRRQPGAASFMQPGRPPSPPTWLAPWTAPPGDQQSEPCRAGLESPRCAWRQLN